MNPCPAIDPAPVDSAPRAASLRSETRYRRTITWSIVPSQALREKIKYPRPDLNLQIFDSP